MPTPFRRARSCAVWLTLACSANCYPGCEQPAGIGESCEVSAPIDDVAVPCAQTLACVPFDPDDVDSETVCLPPLELETTACNTDDDCVRAGFPIDAFCNTDVRECNCDFPSTWCYDGDVVDVEGCFCTPR